MLLHHLWPSPAWYCGSTCCCIGSRCGGVIIVVAPLDTVAVTFPEVPCWSRSSLNPVMDRPPGNWTYALVSVCNGTPGIDNSTRKYLRMMPSTCSCAHRLEDEPESYVVITGIKSESISALKTTASEDAFPIVSEPSRSTVSPSPATDDRVYWCWNLLILLWPFYSISLYCGVYNNIKKHEERGFSLRAGPTT